MSKSCCFAVVLAVILPVILLLEADAQPTVDETMTCSSTALEDVVRETKKDIKDEINGVKQLLETGNGESAGSNETRLEDVAKVIKELIKDEINEVKKMLALVSQECKETKNETVREIKNELA